jgi:hypothetical protein
MPANLSAPLVGDRMQPRIDSRVVLAASRWSHQQGQLAGHQVDVDAFEGHHVAGTGAIHLGDIARLQHG